MGKLVKITIESIVDGIAPTLGIAGANQFTASLGIDPDLPDDNTTAVRTSGLLVQAPYSAFQGSGLSGVPYWIITTPKDSNVYFYNGDGELISYNSAMTTGSESVIGTPTSGAGNGAAYYNNYIYLATPTNISRYGPLDGTPAIANTFWTATLGLTALDNTITLPTTRNVKIPNHAMHVHVDGKLYICDFDASSSTDTNRGKGLIHKLGTKYGTSGTAHQGAVNDGSAYNALDLPYDYIPIDIESWGNDLVIAAMQTTNDTINQGKAALFFWDTISDSFYRQVPLVDPMVTALLNHNGDLIVWSGSMNNGSRVSRYLGGYSFEQLAFFEEGFSPPAGAVDGMGNRVAWGAFTTYPENSASVYAMGYKSASLNPRALHNIIKTTASASSSTGMVSCLKYVQQASFITPRLVVGWVEGSNRGIDKLGSTFGVSVWRSRTYYFGVRTQIKRITIPLMQAVGSQTITPKIYYDSAVNSETLTVINNTNFTNSEKVIVLNPNNLIVENNFLLELRWSGTAQLTVGLPIEIELEVGVNDP